MLLPSVAKEATEVEAMASSLKSLFPGWKVEEVCVWNKWRTLFHNSMINVPTWVLHKSLNARETGYRAVEINRTNPERYPGKDEVLVHLNGKVCYGVVSDLAESRCPNNVIKTLNFPPIPVLLIPARFHSSANVLNINLGKNSNLFWYSHISTPRWISLSVGWHAWSAKAG